MADLRGFDANHVEPMGSFDPLPAGKYVAAIVSSDYKTTKAGDGQFLELVFQVLEGEHQGRQLWVRLNLRNANPTAVKIAQAELSSICRAVGVMQPQDSAQLHDIPLAIHVKVRKRSDTDEPENVIRKYEPRQAAQPAANVPKSSVPPWKRHAPPATAPAVNEDDVPF